MTDKPCSEIARETVKKWSGVYPPSESMIEDLTIILQTERTAREEVEATLKEKDAEIWQLKMELAESKDSHTAKQRLRLCDKINKLESQLQAQAEVNKAVSGLLRKIEVCSYIDEILEEVDVVHNALTRLEAEG